MMIVCDEKFNELSETKIEKKTTKAKNYVLKKNEKKLYKRDSFVNEWLSAHTACLGLLGSTAG